MDKSTPPKSGSNDKMTPDDHILPFQVGESARSTAVRGHVVRLSGSIDTILSAHNNAEKKFNDVLSRFVGETAVLVTMMGASLKFDGKLILQVQGDGPVSMVVADYNADGSLRATASVPGDEPLAQTATTLSELLGTGHMAMTVDQGADMERYQGVTPLDGDSLETAIVSYFQQSEQIPTAVRLAVGKIALPGGREYWRAGGIIAQYVPGEGGIRERGESVLLAEDDQESWNRAEAFLSTTKDDELLDPNLPAENLLYRLFHEDGVRIFDAKRVFAECACSAEKITTVLQRYEEDDLKGMLEDGLIRVTCDFCRHEYIFDQTGKPHNEEETSE